MLIKDEKKTFKDEFKGLAIAEKSMRAYKNAEKLVQEKCDLSWRVLYIREI